MKFGSCVVVLAGALMALGLPSSGKEASAVKNILFIAVDDLKPVLGCYHVTASGAERDARGGDTLIKTPNIDRLADAGTVFLNNHCQQAVCGPSRASLMTGMRPDHTRMRDMNPDIVSLPQYLRSHGFETDGTGKIYDLRYRYVEWFAGGRSTEPYDPKKVVGRELYDYQKDPMETVNVVDVPEYRSVANKMNEQLRGLFENPQ